MTTPTIRTYTELMQIPDYIGRFKYLKLGGQVGQETFGWERYINQKFYRSPEWQAFEERSSFVIIGVILPILIMSLQMAKILSFII